MFAEVTGNWLSVRRTDHRARALYLRHYSSKKSAPWRRGADNFVGSGQPMVLLTPDCLAVFVWLRHTVPRLDGQLGICCTVFRNESPQLSSALIREADDLAWARWPDAEHRRHFTYINPREVASRNPGYCYLMAGWRRLPGRSPGGLIIMERTA